MILISLLLFVVIVLILTNDVVVTVIRLVNYVQLADAVRYYMYK